MTNKMKPLFLLNLLLLWLPLVNGGKNYYTRYSSYPPYCSTPEQMAARSIPPLRQNHSGTVTAVQLVHVTAVLRHGARTPWGNTLNCWEDYWTNPATAAWNCNLSTYLAPPPPIPEDRAVFLFEKRYDALVGGPTSNLLNGTCQLGQLIEQGYPQELQNGKFLRDAYVYNKRNESNPPSSMRLMDARQGAKLFAQVYYRADDDERTLMSGQIVLSGLLGDELHQFVQQNGYYPVLPMHTADRQRDVVDPNYELCPRLRELQGGANPTPEYAAFNASREATILRKFQREVLKVPHPDQDMAAIDCLMTTICTDRPLPALVDDYGKEIEVGDEADGTGEEYGTDLFQRLVEFDAQLANMPLKANDAEWARLGMGPLWFEIRQQMQPHLQGKHTGNAKLSVFSGHDSTLMPLLASLDPKLWPDDKDWPTYAGMVLLELYRDTTTTTTTTPLGSGFLFRLIYNGKVITSQMRQCPPDRELCSARILLDRVDPMASPQRNPLCDPQTGASLGTIDLGGGIRLDPVAETETIMSTPEGTAYLVLIVLLSSLGGAALGCLGGCLCGESRPDAGRCRRRRRQRPEHQPVDIDDDDNELI